MPEHIFPKPTIGVLASHDDPDRNVQLAQALDYLCEKQPDVLRKYQFAITRGTYRRVIMNERSNIRGVSAQTRDFLLEQCGILRLPCRRHGGVVLLANLVVKRQITTVWPFLTPTTTHWLSPENLALLRLCDHCRVNRLMNSRSVVEWAVRSPHDLTASNPQKSPPKFRTGGIKSEGEGEVAIKTQKDQSFAIDWDTVRQKARDSKRHTLALIAHNEMKSRIEDFTADYQNELMQFDRIIATGTTGKSVQEVAPELGSRLRRYNSGPKGGDIEIAAEVIFKQCDVAVFLVDPLSPHPHQEDILVLFGAAILNSVRLLTNERQARKWMDLTHGRVDPLSDFSAWTAENRDRYEATKPGTGSRKGLRFLPFWRDLARSPSRRTGRIAAPERSRS